MTKVISPINGTVDQILLKEGEAVAAGFGTIRVVQLSALKIKAGVSEEYIGQVRVGDSVRVRFPVIGKELVSTIRSVSRVINSQNRTFPIEIGLPKDETQIQPNMLSVLTINNYSNPEALTVPVNIVQKTGKSKFLFVARHESDNKDSWQVERRTVQTGKKYGDTVEIIDGLAAGEHIVTRGYQNLADQQQVLAAVEGVH
jgi:RND family efflux transporter MFP subunit